MRLSKLVYEARRSLVLAERAKSPAQRLQEREKALQRLNAYPCDSGWLSEALARSQWPRVIAQTLARKLYGSTGSD